MFEKTNVLLVPFEVKNLNGRIYKKESFLSLKETYGIDCLDPVVYDIPYNGVQISNTCGIVENVVFSPDGIVGDVRLIDHPFGLAIEPMFRDDLVVVRSICTGYVMDDVVYDAEILRFQFVQKEYDSFNVQ